MPGNISPIYAKVARIGYAQIGSTGPTGADLTSASLLFTADATNGSIITDISIRVLPVNTFIPAVVRFWINNGGAVSTTTNNTLFTEITMPLISVVQTAATNEFILTMPRGGLVLPPGYRVYCALGTWGLSGTLMVTAQGGDY